MPLMSFRTRSRLPRTGRGTCCCAFGLLCLDVAVSSGIECGRVGVCRKETCMARSRGSRLAVREARLITKELRQLGVSSRTIAKIWIWIIGIPVILILGHLMLNYDSGTSDATTLNGVQITYKDQYQSHVHNGTSITLKTLTLTCSDGGDSQPYTFTSGLYPPLKPGYGEDNYVRADCKLTRVNESHQLW